MVRVGDQRLSSCKTSCASRIKRARGCCGCCDCGGGEGGGSGRSLAEGDEGAAEVGVEALARPPPRDRADTADAATIASRSVDSSWGS